MHRIPHGKLWSWPSTWGMCHSLWVFHSRPSWNSHPSLGKERMSIFINGVSASQKNKDGRSLCRSPKTVKSGHQRETELERPPPSLLIQHLNTQRSAELGGKQLRVFGTLCLGLISCVISSSPFSPLPSAPFPCLFQLLEVMCFLAHRSIPPSKPRIDN